MKQKIDFVKQITDEYTEISFEQAKPYYLEMLDFLHNYCEQNNIKYMMYFGTLLGAVRHKGFIPWDDDVDIGMTRENLSKFVEICKTQLDTNKWFLQTPETEKNSADYGLFRLRLNDTKFVIESRKDVKTHDGFCIELWAFDKIPDNSFKAKFYANWFAVLKRIIFIRKGYSSNPRTIYAKLGVKAAKILLAPFSLKTLEKWIVKHEDKYMNKSVKEGCFLSDGYKRNHYNYDCLLNLTTTDFEGYQFSIPQDYEHFLITQYGDYMQLPPEDERINHHKIIEIDFGPYSSIVD